MGPTVKSGLIFLGCIILYYIIGWVLSTIALLSDKKVPRGGKEERATVLFITWFWPIALIYYISLLLIILIMWIHDHVFKVKWFRVLLIGLLTSILLTQCTKPADMWDEIDPQISITGPSSAPVCEEVEFRVVPPQGWTHHFRWEIPWGYDVHPSVIITEEYTVTYSFDEPGLYFLKVFCYNNINPDTIPLTAQSRINIYKN